VEMKRAGVAVLLTCVLAACGQKGPLYLPDRTGEIVTRPAKLPPEPSTGPSSPQTVDTPAAGDTPAPEVTTSPPADAPPDKDKNQKGAANPPH
jgi:predicted small lipoprotein YifL